MTGDATAIKAMIMRIQKLDWQGRLKSKCKVCGDEGWLLDSGECCEDPECAGTLIACKCNEKEVLPGE